MSFQAALNGRLQKPPAPYRKNLYPCQQKDGLLFDRHKNTTTFGDAQENGVVFWGVVWDAAFRGFPRANHACCAGMRRRMAKACCQRRPKAQQEMAAVKATVPWEIADRRNFWPEFGQHVGRLGGFAWAGVGSRSSRFETIAHSVCSTQRFNGEGRRPKNREVGSWYLFFPVVYFRGTLPPKKGRERALLGEVEIWSALWICLVTGSAAKDV